MRSLVVGLLLVVVTVPLAACGGEEVVSEPQPITAEAPPTVSPALPPSGSQPAGAVAPDSRTPTDETPADVEPAADETATDDTAAEETPEGKFASYMEKIPYVVGADKGLAIAAKSGKPVMFFYTATW